MSKNKLLRVTQINAIYFDNELINIFTEQITNILRYLPPGLLSRFQPEINVSIKLIIYYYSIVKCNKTFGQKLLSLQYSNINDLKKLLYALDDLYDYIQERLELWKPNHQLNEVFSYFNKLLHVAKFINISLFLRNGQYPRLKERILGLEQEYFDNSIRYYDSKYMTRELIWNGLIEILVYILPLINYHKLLRVVKNIYPLHKKQQRELIDNPTLNHNTRCVSCQQAPIQPHHMGCQHVFCYVCLKGNQMADAKYQCPSCGISNPTGDCKKVNVIAF